MERGNAYGKNTWRTIFSSVRTNCKETKLLEFQFKFLHRIIVTKKELFRFGIKTDNECLYCGESDSIDHTFANCEFSKNFQNIIHRFNETRNHCNFTPGTKEVLFGISNNPNTLNKKFNYTLLSMRALLH